MSFKLSWRFCRRHWLRGLCAIVALVLLGWGIGVVTPYSGEQVEKSVLRLERSSYFELSVDNTPLLMFSDFTPDSLMTGLSFSSDSVRQAQFSSGGFWTNTHVAWPSCQGRLIAVVGAPTDIMPQAKEVKTIVQKEISYLRKSLRNMRSRQSELRYYLRVHEVQDEGYGIIANYALKLRAQIDTAQSALKKLESIAPKAATKLVRKAIFKVSYLDKNGQWANSVAHVVRYSKGRRYALLQIQSQQMPSSVKALSLLPWQPTKEGAAIGASFLTNASGKSHTTLIEGQLQGNGGHNFSDYLLQDGHPVFTPRGTFIGMKLGRRIVYRDALKQILD